MEKEKIEFCLAAAEKAKGLITDKEERALAEQVIAKCQDWTISRCDVSEELYNCLDNEENGLTLFQERETDAEVIDAWNIIIDTVAYICKCAYLEAGAKYFPEPIESVGEDTIKHITEILERHETDI